VSLARLSFFLRARTTASSHIASLLTSMRSITYSAKHISTTDEMIHQAAGSIGYAAPEVLTNQGHGKPCDVWSLGCVSRRFIPVAFHD
jgi:serine/threonine protein kinase